MTSKDKIFVGTMIGVVIAVIISGLVWLAVVFNPGGHIYVVPGMLIVFLIAFYIGALRNE